MSSKQTTQQPATPAAQTTAATPATTTDTTAPTTRKPPVRLAPLARYRKQVEDAAESMAKIATFDVRLAPELGVAVAAARTVAALMATFPGDWKPAAPTRNVATFKPEPNAKVKFTADGAKKYLELFHDGETDFTVIRIDGTEAVVHGGKGGKARVKLTALRAA